MRKTFAVVAVLVIFTTLTFAGANGGMAVSSGTASFDGGTCSATFVRSASGIINETNRVCNGAASVFYLQFRPLVGTPNPKCDPKGLIQSFVWQNYEASLNGYFLPQQYNACFYLVPLTGTIDSASFTGSDVTLPTTGKYNVCVNGTFELLSSRPELVGDAGYVSSDGFTTPGTHGFIGEFSYLGPLQVNVQVDGKFVDWGSYNDHHSYCTEITNTTGTMNLGVFEGDTTGLSIGDTGTKQDWFADNSGTLNYTITFIAAN